MTMTRPYPDLDLDLYLDLEWDLEWDLELDKKDTEREDDDKVSEEEGIPFLMELSLPYI